MVKRNVNFNAGPAALPLEVLKIVQEELLDYQGSGISILESSHRAKEFEAVNDQTMALVHEVLGLGSDYQVLFMGGGASTQFALIPMNFIPAGGTAAYVDTGEFAFKALKEAQIIAKAHVAFSSKEEKYRRVPKMSEIKYPDDVAYLHICSNNTIEGTQFQEFPETGKIPLVVDMSSDIASRQLDFNKFSMIYAGAQKNLGPAGVTLAVIRNDFLAKGKQGLPTMFTYKTYVDNKSLYNTPPVFAVYIMKLVLEWIKKQGGLVGVEKVNIAKKDLFMLPSMPRLIFQRHRRESQPELVERHDAAVDLKQWRTNSSPTPRKKGCWASKATAPSGASASRFTMPCRWMMSRKQSTLWKGSARRTPKIIKINLLQDDEIQ